MCRHIGIVAIVYLVIATGRISYGDIASSEKLNEHAQTHDRTEHHEQKETMSARTKRVTGDDVEHGFWANRGKKEFNIGTDPPLDPYHGEYSKMYNTYLQYFDERPGLHDRYEKREPVDGPFWGNRGKRVTGIDGLGHFTNTVVRRQSNEDIIPTWPSRGRRGDNKMQQNNRSRREEDEPFWGNRGKRNDDGSVFWGNRGRRSEDSNPFWGNRGRRSDDVSKINDDSPFWGNRGKRDPEDEPFWGNRGKKDPEEPFWGNRGKKDPEEPFWGNRGKRDPEEPFWGNRGKKDPKEPFWGNRGKRDPEEPFWGNRGKRDPEEPFWGNRGKKESEEPFWGNRGKKESEEPFWGNRGKKNNDEPFWGNRGRRSDEDPFWGTRGKKNTEDPFWGTRGKKSGDDPFWGTRGKRGDNVDPFWGNRGKKSGHKLTDEIVQIKNIPNSIIHEKYLIACLADMLIRAKLLKLNENQNQKNVLKNDSLKSNLLFSVENSFDENSDNNASELNENNSDKTMHLKRRKRDIAKNQQRNNLSMKTKDYIIAMLLDMNPNLNDFKSLIIKTKNLHPKIDNADHHLSMSTPLIKLNPQAYNGRIDFNDYVKKPNDDELFILDTLPEDQQSLIQQRTRNEIDEFATINLNEKNYSNVIS